MLQMDIVDAIMRDCGWSRSHAGTAYLREAVRLRARGWWAMGDIYAELARKFRTTSCAVERAMRYAIRCAIERGSAEDFAAWFGPCWESLTNADAICALAFEGGAYDD